METTINERIEKIVNTFYNGNVKYLCRDSGVSESSMKSIIGGRMSKPGSEMLDKIYMGVRQFDISPEWLAFGIGSMLKSNRNEAIITTNLQTNQIPLVSQYAYAGYLCGFADEEYMETLPTIPWDVDNETKGTYIGFEVRGDSMDDRSYESILEGDVLYCRRLKEDLWQYKLHFNDWDFVLVHRTDGILVKRIIDHNIKTGDITIHSLNPLYEDRVINIQEIAQIFNVVEVKRKRRR
ncbi:S24 family peptidase [Dysgonomonas capnocytophagoides]|uniref:S24 family peptidase n=1 Tax=Dysgonomonas capnocytophagoides TaxID=45254 RepID=UPI00291EEBBA|nr:hypothetical protein DCPSUM001_32810 [Dysgonomonas capnocytophagoides]